MRSPGPWAAWDEFFNASHQYDAFTVRDNTVTTRFRERNDFYRLIEQADVTFEATFRFNESGFIEECVLVPQAPDTDRFDQFLEWARSRHPDKLAVLMPGGEIDPDPVNAGRFKTLLIEWRQAAGLPAVDG